MRRRASGIVAAFALFAAASGAARAEDPGGEARPTITARAAPIFGPDASAGDGWTEIAVTVDNAGAAPRKGSIEVSGGSPWARDASLVTRAPFHVPPGRSAVVKMPVHSIAFSSSALAVTVKDDAGAKLTSTTVNVDAQSTPTLIDVDQPPRLAVEMRNWPLSITWAAPYTGGVAGRVPLSTGAPSFDRTTGDPILPDHPAAYASTTVLLIHSDALAKLEPRPLEALLDWVITGGTIAVVPTRPEDLRDRTITALVGGEARAAPPPPVLESLPAVPRPSDGALPEAPEAPDPDDSATPLRFVPISTTTRGRAGAPRIGPSAPVRGQLSGYTGGNLAPSVFGASAAYGTGEVHLLAFDPTSAQGLEDPWVHSRIVDLVTHAWERRSALVMSPGTDHGEARTDEVRRALDPNENFRYSLGVAAILLVLYSVVVGPLTFHRAAKRARPLLPLAWVPIFSALTFGLIVVVGLAGKGWHGRSRRVALVETGAGVGRGAIRRFRGFFTSDSHALSIPGSDAMTLPFLATHDVAVNESNVLQLDRDRATIVGITSLPWQTVMVREDGVYDLKSGVSVISSPAGTDVVNKSGRELREVLVYTPGDGIRHFPRAGDGETLHSAAGRLLVPSARRATRPIGATSMVVHSLDATALGAALGGKEGDALTRQWRPIEAAIGGANEWWPDDLPVVLAQVDGGERARADSGLAVENDALLLRVVGRGGAP